MKVTYHPFVEKDYHRALRYYEKEGPALALRFDEAFKEGVERITATPTAFPFHLKQQIHRRYKLESFPYLIVYRLTRIGVRIVMLKHEKQHPAFGIKRL